MAAKLDTVMEVETPEGVHLHLRCAGLAPRLLAGLLDLLVLLVGLIGVLVVVWFAVLLMPGIFGMTLGPFVMIGLGLLWFGVSWFYPAICELLMDGQTVGKRVMGLRVVQASGAPVTWRHSVVRSVMWSLDLLFCISVPVMLLGRDFRRIGDLAADTVVIYVDKDDDRRRQRAATIVEEASEPASAGRFSLEETQAILAFSERRQSLSEARQRELAGIVAPGLETDAAGAIEALRRHAAYVQGAKR